MGGGGADASADEGNGNGTGLDEVAEDGGGDDFGVHVKVGEEEGDGEGLGERGAAVGGERQGVEEREGELEGLEENGGGASGRGRGHPLGEFVEGSDELHHHLAAGASLLQRRRFGKAELAGMVAARTRNGDGVKMGAASSSLFWVSKERESESDSEGIHLHISSLYEQLS
ncbi:hypothetical protein PanWU01x14_120260 [Parasponia andersonii]|uniref:Uncharacterized protein n=1 Tax=Parasponia andersonii TaxID=3476 RepID=A0A2P5CUW8_PARAD|nr:hypothetical protein PanWU01x14_120260 [Parasponia andersonii]